MAFDNAALSAFELEQAKENGLIREDVMDAIMNSNREIDLGIISMTDATTHDNKFHEWTLDRVPAVSLTDADLALHEAQDIDGNESTFGQRVGNHTQISGGRIVVSYSADASDTIGRGAELGYQQGKYALELERKTSLAMLANQASRKPGDGSTADTEGLSAGLEAQIGGETLIPADTAAGGLWTTTQLGTADSTVQQLGTAPVNGGINNFSSGIIPAWDYSAAVPGALTETALRDACQALFNNTGKKGMVLRGLNSGVVNRKWSEYSFTSTARIATQLNNSSNGERSMLEGKGASNIFITDFGVIEFEPEVIFPTTITGGAGTKPAETLFLLQPEWIERSYFWGTRSERQAKTGLTEKWQTSVAWQINCLDPQRQGMVQNIDIDPAVPMVA